MAPTDDTGIIEIAAANVRRARIEAGLSQEQLAHEAGVDRTYVSQVERRKRNVTITVLARLAAALGTSPDRLLIPQPAPRKRN
jgi:transcriptional regulator with XRE-family HTH domain